MHKLFYISLLFLLLAFEDSKGQSYFPDQNANLTAGLAAVPLAYTLDNTMRNFIRSGKSTSADYIFGATNQFGEPYFTLPLIAGLYFGGMAADNKELQNTGLYLGEAYALNAAITFSLKGLFGRARPYNNLGNNEFNFWSFSDDYMSFPSGHSSSAFVTATVISHRINKPAAYYISYSLAFMTMMSRIYYDKHWFSDTAFGAFIGTLSGLIILELNSDDDTVESPENAQSLPIFSISVPVM